MFFFFKQKTAYELRISDWSSDVCSSDLFQYECPLQRCRKFTFEGADGAVSRKPECGVTGGNNADAKESGKCGGPKVATQFAKTRQRFTKYARGYPGE